MGNKDRLEFCKSNRVGEIVKNKYGTEMKIVEYSDSHRVLIEFQDEHMYRKIVDYNRFKNGAVSNPYDKTMFGIGYLGVGKYRASTKNKRMYCVWQDIFRRCYGVDPKDTKPSYAGCTVSPIWYNFQNFGEWYEKNYYEVPGERMQIDKDILHKGNKIYSPETCIIVPNEINGLVVKRKEQRGDTPIGVYYNKKMQAYVSFCWTGGRMKEYLGVYTTPEGAFYAYKKRKEQYIKEVADKYKNQIPQVLYDALYKYEVEITD